MRIVEFDKITDNKLRMSQCIDGVTFLSSDENELLLEAVRDIETLKKWFNLIGIKYNTIDLSGSRFVYTVGNKQLSLSELSSGERYILYLMACKKLNKQLIAQGLFERVGSRLEKVIFNNLLDYENLIVVVYNALLPKEFIEYMVEEVQ